MAAYVKLSNGVYIGITTDTKPVNNTVQTGTVLYEFNAGFTLFKIYVNDGTNWVAQTDFTETLTNKTLTSPTINTPTLGAPLTVANGGTGAATLTGILKGNGTSAFTAVTAPSGTIVGTTDTQTLTNKTLTTPIISTISNTGTLTLPTSTDTIVGKATTDTLTNKTLTAPAISDPTISTTLTSSTTFPSIFPTPPKRWGTFYPSGGSATPTSGALLLTQSVVGSGTFSAVLAPPLTAGVAGRWATGATINSIIGHRHANLSTERDLNPWMEFKCYLRTITNARMFIGFSSATTVPGSTADYLANLSGVGFKFDTGVHATNIAIMQNSGGANSDITTLANVGTMTTGVHTYALRADNANSKFQYSYDGGTWGDINTAIPAATTGLTFQWYVETLTAGNINWDILYFIFRQDA